MYSTVVFKAFRAILLPRTSHSVKAKQTVAKSCKTSASSRRMQQHWGFPPKVYFKIPNASPADRKVLGRPPLMASCLLQPQGAR